MSEGVMLGGKFIPKIGTAKFLNLENLEGSSFNYLIGENIVKFKIDSNLDITGEIPTSQLGLKFNIGSSYFEAYSIKVRLDGDRLTLFDDKVLNVNGVDVVGAKFTWFV